MANLADNVVPIIVLDDDDDEPGNSMPWSASKLADSQVMGCDMKNVEYGERFDVPTVGKAVEVENVTPNSGETILVDGIGLELNGHASLNVCAVSEQEVNGDGNSSSIGRISQEHGFLAGDFVWCKIKKDPWWPARVYDSTDASVMALRYRGEGNKLLVVLFGTGTASWCLPSQLLPFVDNFAEMSSSCNSGISLRYRIFLKAVQEALDEFGRIIETDMICKCVPENQRSGLARPMAKNGGVKAGVLVPEVKVNRLSVPEYEPFKVLAEGRHVAKTLSGYNKLQLAIMKHRLSAFYRFKGRYQVPLYDEPVYIEGLEESVETDSASRKPRETKVISGDLKREIRNSTPRQRKESKYLSHPYAGSNYKRRKSVTGPKQKRQSPSECQLSPAVGATPAKVESCFVSDVRFVRRELEVMSVCLEKNQTKLSVEEKASLMEDINHIMESVANMSEKVETASEKVRLAEEDEASPGGN